MLVYIGNHKDSIDKHIFLMTFYYCKQIQMEYKHRGINEDILYHECIIMFVCYFYCRVVGHHCTGLHTKDMLKLSNFC